MAFSNAKVHKKMDISPLEGNNSKKVRIFAFQFIGVKGTAFYRYYTHAQVDKN
jgi:hypothetical protein